jgi:hypothetical protein
MKSAVALMACHKRSEKPLVSIARYYACDVPEGCTRQQFWWVTGVWMESMPQSQ